jgi:hypothetical protein
MHSDSGSTSLIACRGLQITFPNLGWQAAFKSLPKGMKMQLGFSWAAKHRMILHRDSPPLAKPPPGMWHRKRCHYFGVCVCSGQGRLAHHFQERFVVFMKHFFVSEKKKKSASRILLEDAFIVFKFTSASPVSDSPAPGVVEETSQMMDAGPADMPAAAPQDPGCMEPGHASQDLWCHAGYFNFSSWMFTAMKLHPFDVDDDLDGEMGQSRIQHLRVVTESMQKPNGLFEFCILWFLRHVAFELEWSVQVHVLLSDSQPLANSEMAPDSLEVQDFPSIPVFRFWKGSAAEDQYQREKDAKERAKAENRNRRSQAAANQPAQDRPPRDRGRGQGRARAARGRGRGAGRQRAEPVVAVFDDVDVVGPAALASEEESGASEKEDDAVSNYDPNDGTSDEDAGEDPAAIDMFLDMLAEQVPAPDDDVPFPGVLPPFPPPSPLLDNLDEDMPGVEGNNGDQVSDAIDNTVGGDDNSGSVDSSSSNSSSSGSSSGSSDSSDSDGHSGPGSDDGGADGNAGPVPVRRHLKGPRQPGMQEVVFEVPGLGTLRFNVMNRTICAHCTCPNHFPDCRKQRTVCATRTAAAARAGQGRPIGLLAAWLHDSHAHATNTLHSKAPIATFEARAAARELFNALPGASEFAFYERPRSPAEGDEPLQIK